MNNYNQRKGNLINIYNFEKTNVDDYIFCSECGEFVYEYCAIHGPLLIIPDDEVPCTIHPSVPLSALTIPHVFLHHGASTIPGAGIGVFTTLTLPRGIRFGPYQGRKTSEVTSDYCWQIHDGKNNKSHYVDAANANNSNWMRYVNCSRHWSEQNLVAYQYKGKLYYRTIKIIPKFTELMVFYGGEFVDMLGINIHRYNSPISYLHNLGVPTSNNLDGSAENKNGEQINPQNNLTNYFFTTSNEANETKKITENTNENPNTTKFYTSPNNSQENLPFIAKDYIKHSEIDNVNEQNDNYYLSKVLINEMNKTKKRGKHICNTHICNICHYETVKESLLAFHLRVHSCKNIFSCTNCKYITDRNSSLKDHIKTHTNAKQFKCDICQRKFSRNFKLNQHVKNQICQKPLECDNCQRKFSRNSDLDRHVKSQICTRILECDICQKKFSRKNHLSRHVKTHRGGPVMVV